MAPSDPEPEFVDFNHNNEVVVTLQENNHIVIVDASKGEVINHFSAGEVDLYNVDIYEEGALTFDGVLLNRKREPDAVKWIDNHRFVTANEGDYEGGSRGFTIFNKSGEVLFESNLDFEYRAALAGHYPEKRSGNKGIEPEGLEVAHFGNNTYIFVLAERAGIVGVYKDTGAAPEFIQLLPAGIAPEGAIAIPSRNLFVVANEKDLVNDKGPRSQVMIYTLSSQKPDYPQLESIMQNGRPIGWGALSGLAADDKKAGILYAVNDSFYRSQPTILTIDTNKIPAKIIKATLIKRDGMPAQKLDLEGITTDGNDGFWLVSEGHPNRLLPHAIYHVDAAGEITKKGEVAFPKALRAVAKRHAAEGITRIGDNLWVAIQRPWQDDPTNTVKLLSYNIKSKSWSAVRYPIEPTTTGWVGVSEITAYKDYLYIIERDNQLDKAATIKRLYRVAIDELQSAAPLESNLPLVSKELVRDFIPDLKQRNGYVVDKVEGFAIDKNGYGYVVTDNDGLGDSSGETHFFSTGKM